MTMAIDNQSRHYGNMGSLENLYATHLHASPQFSDPWGSHSISQPQAPIYAASMVKQETPRPTPMSYPQVPVSAPSLGSGSSFSNAEFGGSDLLSLPQDIPRSNYPQDATFQTSPQTTSSYNPSSYSSITYAHSLHHPQQQQQDVRRMAGTEHNSRAEPPSFGELDASQGMLALSHQNLAELTPRNLYEARNARPSTDGYGFPSTHSLNSSISAPSHRDSYPYYSPSVASADSATDYSSAASDGGYDSMPASRTLPRPSQLMGANLGPPAPQTMMSQFSSKTSSNTQKKHKCKVCDKRFTRPSSLQTHMYSHTGEKPFACNADGCGRHFSVVSNLRRHKKVHKGEAVSTQSDDED